MTQRAVRVVFVQPDGQRVEVAAEADESLMQLAVNNSVKGIIGECGGDLTCSTCHLFVDPEWFHRLDPVSEEEEAMLDCASEEPTPYSRLGCQVRCASALDGLVVRVAPTQR